MWIPSSVTSSWQFAFFRGSDLGPLLWPTALRVRSPSWPSLPATDEDSERLEPIATGVAAFFREDLPPIEELPLDQDPEKNLLMIHGLSAFHNGHFHGAMTCFLKILRRYPDDESASFWLARSFLGAGLDGHGKIELERFLERFPDSQQARKAKSLLASLKQKEASHHDQR